MRLMICAPRLMGGYNCNASQTSLGLISLKMAKLRSARPSSCNRQFIQNIEVRQAEIKARHFEEATRLLDGASEPLQAVILSVGFVLSGDRYRARAAIAAVNDNVPPQLLTLKKAMLARVDNSATRSDEWFIEASEEAVLQLAA